MAIITINSEMNDEGLEIGKTIANKYGFTVATHEDILKSLRMTSKEFTNLFSSKSFVHPVKESDKKVVINRYKAELFDIAQNDNVIFCGPFMHLMFQKSHRVIKVKLQQTKENRKQKDTETSKAIAQYFNKADSTCKELYNVVLASDAGGLNGIIQLLSMNIESSLFAINKEVIHNLEKMALYSKIVANLVSHSPNAKVELTKENVLFIDNLNVRYVENKTARKELSEQLTQEYQIADVVYKQPLSSSFGYVNPFFNLEIYRQ